MGIRVFCGDDDEVGVADLDREVRGDMDGVGATVWS